MPVDISEYTPSAALMPASTEEVQRIVAVCNRYKVPVWPISTGHNFGYGSAAPGTRGQVVLDLGRMNRILEVDAELCTALVEPGVTYQMLHDYIQKRNLPLWLDVPSPSAIVGPVGNTLDRGVGYTAYGDHFLFSCGMEVVLANGEILRTGMGSLPNSTTWQVFKWGYGPYLDGIFTQSNYGIVTKLGIWLMPAPPVYKPFMVEYPNEADIEKIVDAIRPLRIANIIPNGVGISSALGEAVVFVKRSAYYEGEGQIPDSVVQRIMREHNIAPWTLYGALYGTQEQVDVNWKIIQSAFGASGGTIRSENEAGDHPGFAYHKVLMRGDLTLREFGYYNWRGGGGNIFFAPVTVAKGGEALKQIALAKRIMTDHAFDYVHWFVVGLREMHHIIVLLHDHARPEERKRAYVCCDRLIVEFATCFMDKVADVYGPVKREVNRKIKQALDPNGVIAPGKSGIFV
jgi:4-cresol dehydrogenase (hydroxylating) flavoprotein subunit